MTTGKTQLFIIATILLAATTTIFLPIIINTVSHPPHHHRNPPTNNSNNNNPPLDFPSNASQVLQSNGFNFIANLIHVSPDLFLSTPESTIFAIPDSAMSNLSIPPYLTIELVTYHISPTKLTFQDLFSKPLHTCFNTMFQQHKISITKQDAQNQLLEINNVLITNPNMFIHESLTIHGVNGPFASFNFHPQELDLPICNTHDQTQYPNNTIVNKLDYTKAEWKMVVKFLISSGYAPFAFWLNNLLDEIIQDHPDLRTMTVFVPPVIEQMSGTMMGKFVRAHIVPKKHSFKHLVTLQQGETMGTLCPGKDIEITGTVVNLSEELLLINRVEITSPDLLSSRSFVVHGIARSFAMDEAFKV
ncbi:fasciclin-like arabinogalactan protein 21 [Bidens hawaiensis]|uniref:fasciclin-like arabinogalactan protein 21 n=1 Tax=Bidens hawaiensis TaxID=980011 RepID=UPI00404B02CC